jgi:hypothetical protein
MGNFDRETDPRLLEKSWRHMQPFFDEARQKAKNKLHELIGTGKASADPTDVLPAAFAGRIETLFADPEAQLIGAFDASGGNVKLSVGLTAAGDDLISEAAIETLLHRGDVFVQPAAQLPMESPLAAIYRY